MLRLVLATVSLLFLSKTSFAGEKSPLDKQVQALQRHIQKLIEKVEPSVAYIRVSRSDSYYRYGNQFPSENLGQLGRFSPNSIRLNLIRKGIDPKKIKQILTRLDLANPNNIPDSSGTGVIISNSGLVLTNYHVVREATKIYVRVGNECGSYADIFSADPRSDLAVLKLLNPKLQVTPLPLGSKTPVKRGQFVLSFSHSTPPEFKTTTSHASWGMINNLCERSPQEQNEERNHSLYNFETLIQTDLPLRRGYSGGPLLNLKGEIIGLNTSLAALQGPNAPGSFAIPINDNILRILTVLQKGREVEYGFLGVGFKRTAGKEDGVSLSYVIKGSPADKSGLQSRDCILAINGKEVRRTEKLLFHLGTLLAGSKITLEVRKSGSNNSRTYHLQLSKLFVPGKAIASFTQRPFFRGLRVDWTSLLVQKNPFGFQLEEIPPGVVISDVKPNTPAATALLKTGDVITHVNDHFVKDPATFYNQLRNIRGPVEFTLISLEKGQPGPKVTINN